MTKEEKVRFYIDLLHNDIENIFWVLQVKYAGFYEINRLKDNYSEKIGITRLNDSQQNIIFVIDINTGKLKSSYKVLETEARRAFITDLYLIIARYSIFLHGLIDDKEIIDPAISDNAIDQAPTLLNPFLKKEDKDFLDFFHKVRNSLIHYDGNHNKKSRLDYTFSGTHFLTTENNLGQQIEWSVNELIELYQKIKLIYNKEKLLAHPFLLRKLT